MRRYGIADLCFAALYAYLGFGVAASRSPLFQTVLGVVIAVLAIAGATLVLDRNPKRVRMVGIAASSMLLAFTVVCLVLLALSSAYLFGVYGAIGRALGALTLIAAALVLELFGLLAVFQLRFHLRT